MRIMVLTSKYVPDLGGVEIATYLMARGLCSKGHTIIIVTGTDSNSFRYEIDKNIKIFRFPANKSLIAPWRGLIFMKKYFKDIEKIVKEEKIDIINIIHHNEVSSWAYLLKYKMDIPIVSTVHTLLLADDRPFIWRLSLVEPFRRSLYLYPILWFEKKSLRSSDYLITISNKLLSSCRGIRNDNKVELVPNAINFEQFNSNIVPKNIDNIEGHFYKILCSGRYSPEKGQIFLIRAIAKVSESVPVHLFLLGGGKEKYKKQLESEVNKFGISNIVHFIRGLPYDEIPGIYKSMDLIVQPSLSETFGIAILENMALGNVVVASSVGGIPEIINDKINGLLVPPADSDVLADTIVQALVNTELREKIQKNAQITASSYNISKVCNDYEDVLKRTLRGFNQNKVVGSLNCVTFGK